MAVAAVIVAAGKGVRAGGEIPKQYQDLAGCPVAARSILAFARHAEISRLIVVVNPDDAALFQSLILPHLDGFDVQIVNGGAERANSVQNGLNALNETDTQMVLIHDAARPLVTVDLINRVLNAVRKTGAAAPALPVSDTLWRGKRDLVVEAQSRDGLFRAQTPQGFQLAPLQFAHGQFQGNPTDDVSVARSAGIAVEIVAGEQDNIKITTQADFARATRILGADMDIRTGNGFDVHAFTKGTQVTLCGVDIAHDKALKGHSDADVAMHAVTDAIYGALGQGDIGQWFPPSQAEWQGAASSIFLVHAVELAREMGFTITHTDCTIVCEHPKIGPHANKMRAHMASLMTLDVDRISVKATTSEQLGFTGRGEGIAALATATLVKT